MIFPGTLAKRNPWSIYRGLALLAFPSYQSGGQNQALGFFGDRDTGLVICIYRNIIIDDDEALILTRNGLMGWVLASELCDIDEHRINRNG